MVQSEILLYIRPHFASTLESNGVVQAHLVPELVALLGDGHQLLIGLDGAHGMPGCIHLHWGPLHVVGGRHARMHCTSTTALAFAETSPPNGEARLHVHGKENFIIAML